jgi:hypothetical protein
VPGQALLLPPEQPLKTGCRSLAARPVQARPRAGRLRALQVLQMKMELAPVPFLPRERLQAGHQMKMLEPGLKPPVQGHLLPLGTEKCQMSAQLELEQGWLQY